MPPEKSEKFSCPFLSFNYGERTIDFRLSNNPCAQEKSGPIFTVTDSCIRPGIDTVAI
jgi:hypothetical protein